MEDLTQTHTGLYEHPEDLDVFCNSCGVSGAALKTTPCTPKISCNGHQRIYEDGVGYECRHCGADLNDDDDDEDNS
jgi:hypothetical protein